MNTGVQIRGYREDTNGTDLIIHIPDRRLGDMLQRKRIKEAELRLDDGRHISSAQRKRYMLQSVILLILRAISQKRKKNG